MPRAIAYRLYIAWDGSNYVNESARLIQATGENKLTAPDQIGQGRGIVDRCTLELSNHDGRYSPLNSGGALYASIQAGGAYHRPMYLEVAIDGSTYSRVFTGVIKLPQETTPTPNAAAVTRIECRSVDEKLLGRRMSTSAGDLRANNVNGVTEGMIIYQWLGAAGASGTLDAGLFVIPWSWLDDESVLEEIWQLAGACGGRFYADPDGTLRYEDMTHWLKAPHTTSQETLTRADFSGLEPVYSDADLYNSVTVEASSRGPGASDLLWEPDEQVIIPPNSNKPITARLRQAAYSIDAPVWAAATAGALDITASVTVTVTAYNVQRVEMTVANAHATEAAYLHPFSISGRALTGGPTQEETRTSAANGSNSAWWTSRGTTRSKAIRGNAYIQTRAHAGTLAQYLLHRSEAPRLAYKLRGCPGKPARRCGDRITINDTAIMSAARDAFIVGINWRLTANGFVQDIECIDAQNLAPYASEGYFVIGTNVLGAAGAGTARLWY
jgi:hypothetical protein